MTAVATRPEQTASDPAPSPRRRTRPSLRSVAVVLLLSAYAVMAIGCALHPLTGRFYGPEPPSGAASLSAASSQDLTQPLGGRDHGRGVQPAGLPREPLNWAGDADGGDHLSRG